MAHAQSINHYIVISAQTAVTSVEMCVCVSTADSTFSGPLVGVVVVVGLLLSAITAVAVILLIVWMK